MLIESGQDESFWNRCYTPEAVKTFTDQGIRVFAWSYIPGNDGLVLDVEIDWEQYGDHKQAAIDLCDGIRAKKPDVWLGYTSWGWVNCGDGFFPKVYWSDRGIGWKKGYDDAITALNAAKLSLWLFPKKQWPQKVTQLKEVAWAN